MSDLKKYRGIIPAFYACYDDNGEVSTKRIEAFVEYLINKKVQGLYVGGSSGECIYQNIEERKLVLETVMKVAKGKLVVIAHIGAPSTRDSITLAKHADSLGVDALSSIPPIYFGLSEAAIEKYWSDMFLAIKTDFIIYNIPQTTPYSLTKEMLQKMCTYKQVIGVKNSSMPVLDIMKDRMYCNKDFVIFNGPDEQYVAGRLMGANAGIGGTYGAMPELYLKAEEYISSGNIEKSQAIQIAINECIFALCSCKAHMYSVIKETLKQRGMDIGTGRLPLLPVERDEIKKVEGIRELIEKHIAHFCK